MKKIGWFKKAKTKWYIQRVSYWSLYIMPESSKVANSGIFGQDHERMFWIYRTKSIKYPNRFKLEVR